MPDPAARSPKAEQTRRSIVDAAMRLFRTAGYDKATMRAIASEAGVSVGNAYYYFGSKEHLVQAFYDQLQEQHAAAVVDVLARETSFAGRLTGVLTQWLEVAEPHHEFAGQFFKNAADPRSPLSPFSEESAPARVGSIDVFRRVVAGSNAKPVEALRGELPELLWLMEMGVVLFWVYDASPHQQRTRTLIAAVVPVVDRLVKLSRLPVVRGLVDDVVGLLRTIRS